MKNAKKTSSVILSEAKNPFKSILMKLNLLGKIILGIFGIKSALKRDYSLRSEGQSKTKNQKLKINYGFTLAELIVVITILSILGTISFISFGGYSSQARDSSRVADLSNISKGLLVQYTISGKYPIPDSYITLTASGTPIGYQGKVGTNVKRILKISEPSIDPLDKTEYTYSTNINQDKYQLLGFLEDGDNVNLSLNNGILGSVNALDYSNRHPLSKGDSIGILLSSGSLEPVENLKTNIFTGVDVVSSNTGYVVKFDKTRQIYLSGSVLKTLINSDGLVLYYPLEEQSGTGISDYSGFGNNGKIDYPTNTTFTGGKLGNGVYFGDYHKFCVNTKS